MEHCGRRGSSEFQCTAGELEPFACQRSQASLSVERVEGLIELAALFGLLAETLCWVSLMLPNREGPKASHTGPKEIRALVADLMISVSGFFRVEAWRALDDIVLAPLLTEQKADIELRFWVPACATGEEAYSLAMLAAAPRVSRDKRPKVEAAQAIEHYEISRYGTLRTWADELGVQDAASCSRRRWTRRKRPTEL